MTDAEQLSLFIDAPEVETVMEAVREIRHGSEQGNTFLNRVNSRILRNSFCNKLL
jgi:hypothetical protein